MPTQDQNSKKSSDIFSLAQQANMKEVNSMLGNAQKTGNGIWQEPVEERMDKVYPKVVYLKDEESKLYSPPSKALIVLLQAQKEIGSKDSCWIPKYMVDNNPDMKLKENATIIKYIKDRKDGSQYLESLVNRSQVEGKGVPEIEVRPSAKDQIYLDHLLTNFSFKTKYNKDNEEFMMPAVSSAVAKTNVDYIHYKKKFDLDAISWEDYKKASIENAKRYSDLLAFDTSKPVSRKNDKEIFMHFCAEEMQRKKEDLQNGEARSPFARAAQRAMTELQWGEEKARGALEAVMPSAVVDPLLKSDHPKSVDNVMESAQNAMARQRDEYTKE